MNVDKAKQDSATHQDTYKATLLVGWFAFLMGLTLIIMAGARKEGITSSNYLIGVALWAAGYVGCIILPSMFRRIAFLEDRVMRLESAGANVVPDA